MGPSTLVLVLKDTYVYLFEYVLVLILKFSAMYLGYVFASTINVYIKYNCSLHYVEDTLQYPLYKSNIAMPSHVAFTRGDTW